MDEKKERSLRRRAIRWILDGMRSSIILKRLGRSRVWLSKNLFKIFSVTKQGMQALPWNGSS